MCPNSKKDTGRKKKNGKYPKGWTFSPPNLEEEEDEADEEPIQFGNN